ncbi:MAG: hypothetical protein NTY19_23295, partial [Planctomycetota bacterium]|nr:hypothetical protein [Planctomycetota bacterium]
VQYLLERYGLADTRTRFLIMDQRRRCISDDRPLLTLGHFQGFFGQFPVTFQARSPRQEYWTRITVPKLLLSSTETTLQRQFREFRDDLPPDSVPHAALVIQYPHVRVPSSLVVHNVLPLNANAPGTHLLWTHQDGDKIAIETLSALLDNVDQEYPPKDWCYSREHPDFREIAPRKARRQR